MSEVETPGRRERHKAATREAIQGAALRLFTDRGYPNVTVRDIAEEVGITERTFFRYFPSKVDLILGEVVDLIPELQLYISERPLDEPPLEAILNGFVQVAVARGGRVGLLLSGPPARLPEVDASGPRVLFKIEDALAKALQARLASQPDPPPEPDLTLRAGVIARSACAALRTALFVYADLPDAEKRPEVAIDLLQRSFGILRRPSG